MRVEFRLVRNPKVGSKGFVAEVDLEKGELKFLKPVIPVRERGILVAGEYEIEPGKYYIIKRNESSHKNSRIIYELYYGTEKLTWIKITNGTIEFADDEVKEIYTRMSNGRRVINTLIEYARSRKHQLDVEEIVKSEIEDFIKKLEERYGVRIKIQNVVVEK